MLAQTKKVLEECKQIDEEYHYFNKISKTLALEQAENPIEGKLTGKFISLKDAICVKDVESRAGSRILSGYRPVFDATVAERIKKAGGIIIGKTSQDVFGFGSFNVNVGLDFKVPKNPLDKTRCCGGSSGGGCGITKKASFATIGIVESTGGSIVDPASFCGVYAICPTYGRVSRYGLMDYANSMDKLGACAKDMHDVALMMEVIAGYDEKDSTCMNKPVEKYTDFLNQDIKGIKIGVIKEAFKQGVDEPVKKATWDYIKKLESLGAQYEEITLPITTKYSLETYYLLAMSEASTNLAKYCGIRYGKHEDLEGHFNEYFSKVRSMHFNEESKRRIILGTFARMAGYRDAYYLKAAKVRTLIINEYKKTFKKHNILISPTMPTIAPKFEEIEKLTPMQNYMMDILTCGPNLAGLPHCNVPFGNNKGMPIGIMLITDHFKESELVRIGGV